MKLPPAFVDDTKEMIHVVIETPKGSRNKFAFQEDSWLFLLKKILPAGTDFPLDFGFVPHTKCDDGDPLDVLVILEQSTYPGCLLRCRPIGIIKGEQTDSHSKKKVRNDRILAVADASREYALVKDIKDLPENHLKDLTHFFIYYNQMEGSVFKLLDTSGHKAAYKAIKAALK